MNKIAKGTLATGKFIGKTYLNILKWGLVIIIAPYLIPFFILAIQKKKKRFSII